MLTIAIDLGRWIGRHIVLFLLILLILFAGSLLFSQIKEFLSLESSSRDLANGLPTLQSDWSALKSTSEKSVASLKNSASTKVDVRITDLNLQIELKTKAQKALEEGGLMVKLKPTTHIDLARLKFEIDVASQERSYLQAMRDQKRQGAVCEGIRQRHVGEYRAYEEVKSKLAPFGLTIPFTEERKKKNNLTEQLGRLGRTTLATKREYDLCILSVQSAKARIFALSSVQADEILRDLQGRLDAIQGQTSQHWLRRVEQLLPAAVAILASVVLIPYFIRVSLYFLLAPIATRQLPICLVPSVTSRSVRVAVARKSAVSISVAVPEDSELVVKPAYFHSAPNSCRTSSRFVLNRSFLMTSLAAGMYNLTQVRSDATFVATVSAGQEGLDELLQLDMDAGEAICVRPSNLVGFIQAQGTPVRISSHWRLGSLQAWLTMQLRFLVFHGPASLIVKGSRGVRVEHAAGGKSIEQASTLGFSANLSYATNRTETALAYLTGKKGLMRDSFSGQPGFFIFEEMPDRSNRSGVSGRGLEGFSDAMLKLFGV